MGKRKDIALVPMNCGPVRLAGTFALDSGDWPDALESTLQNEVKARFLDRAKKLGSRAASAGMLPNGKLRVWLHAIGPTDNQRQSAPHVEFDLYRVLAYQLEVYTMLEASDEEDFYRVRDSFAKGLRRIADRLEAIEVEP